MPSRLILSVHLATGSSFAGYEWCMTDKYNKEDETHRAIKLGIEVVSRI
jgi:hypothetical protein